MRPECSVKINMLNMSKTLIPLEPSSLYLCRDDIDVTYPQPLGTIVTT